MTMNQLTKAQFRSDLLGRMSVELRAKSEAAFGEIPEKERVFASSFAKMAGGEIHLTLNFFDFIGDYWEGTTTSEVSKAIKRAGGDKVTHIFCNVNSHGGYLHDGVGIRNVLVSHPAMITTRCVGVAYSAASVIMTAGSVREMPLGTTQMFHNALNGTYGNAIEHRKSADFLDTISSAASKIYAQCSGETPAESQALMDAETYLDADQCLARGFATSIGDDSGASPKADTGNKPKLRTNRPLNTALVAAMNNQPGPTIAGPQAPPQEAQDTMELAQALEAKSTAEANVVTLKAELVTAKGDLEKSRAEVEKSKEAQASLDSLVKATGEDSASEALGSIATAVEARDVLLPEATAKLEIIKEDGEKAEGASLLAKLRSETRISMAQEKDMWPKMDLAGKRTFAKTAPKLSGASRKEENGTKGDHVQASGADAETWDEMKPAARAALKKSDPELHSELRASAGLN